MSYVAIAASVATLGSAAIKGSQAAKQSQQSAEIASRNQNPGYTANPGLVANEEIFRGRFSNYMLPGMSSAIDDINSMASGGLSAAREGSQSSSDLLGSVARIVYGSQLGRNNLAVSSAQGERQAMMDYAGANAALGNESVAANQWEREQYLRDRNDAANLRNASTANIVNTADSVLGAGVRITDDIYRRKNPITTQNI